MRIRATFQVPRLNLDRYKAQLQETLGDAIAQAAFEWLSAVTPLIPVWSGASKATFLPLASQIGFALSAAPVGNVKNRVSLGLNNAVGEVKTDANKGEFSFTYATSLQHLIYNEFNNANITPDPSLFAQLIEPGPYHFQEKGQEALRPLLGSFQLPDPSKAITKTVIRV